MEKAFLTGQAQDHLELAVVITGDIVHSSRLVSQHRRQLYQVMKAVASEVYEFFRGAVPLMPDIFSGDSWQILVSSPETALDVALFYRAGIRAGMAPLRVDTRVSMGLGSVEFMPEERVSQGDGEAYRLSGRALKEIKGHHRMAFVFPKSLDCNLLRAIKTIVYLCDTVVVRWTPRQSLAIKGAIRGLSQEEIAASWPGGRISQQAVAQHLSRAGWYGIEKGLSFFRKAMNKIHTI